MGYDVTDVADPEGEGPDGMVRKVRRSLGARAFGFNYFVFGAPLDKPYEPPDWG